MDEQIIIAQMSFINIGQVHIWFRTSADAMLLVRRTSASQISRQPLHVCWKICTDTNQWQHAKIYFHCQDLVHTSIIVQWLKQHPPPPPTIYHKLYNQMRSWFNMANHLVILWITTNSNHTVLCKMTSIVIFKRTQLLWWQLWQMRARPQPEVVAEVKLSNMWPRTLTFWMTECKSSWSRDKIWPQKEIRNSSGDYEVTFAKNSLYTCYMWECRYLLSINISEYRDHHMNN